MQLKKTGIALAALPIVGLALFGIARAGADTGGGARPGKVVETIYAINKNDGFYRTQLQGPDVHIGDMYVFHDDVYRTDSEWHNPVLFGKDSGMCQVTLVEGTSITTYCVITKSLPKGQIVVSGYWNRDNPNITLAIVGGTGDYNNVRGEYQDFSTATETEHAVYRITN